MRRGLRLTLSVVLAYSLIGSAGSFAQQSPAQQEKGNKEQQEREGRERGRKDEINYTYKGWLEEVGPIIQPEELEAFKKLSTNEERESFIEIFWINHDPTPDTQENEFRDEHYRRIAYANERFSSGIPGWKTDRGRIYIIWGPPDEIESHPSGGRYTRPSWEGGGDTSVHPFEQWRYRHMEGVGEDVVLEFVDRTGSGEYRLTMDPSEKDALLYVPGAGPSELEAHGVVSKVSRFTRGDGTHLPVAMGGEPSWMNEFERLSRYVNVQRPPVRFKDLEAGSVVAHPA